MLFHSFRPFSRVHLRYHSGLGGLSSQGQEWAGSDSTHRAAGCRQFVMDNSFCREYRVRSVDLKIKAGIRKRCTTPLYLHSQGNDNLGTWHYVELAQAC